MNIGNLELTLTQWIQGDLPKPIGPLILKASEK